jgi:hypothetical protein
MIFPAFPGKGLTKRRPFSQGLAPLPQAKNIIAHAQPAHDARTTDGRSTDDGRSMHGRWTVDARSVLARLGLAAGTALLAGCMPAETAYQTRRQWDQGWDSWRATDWHGVWAKLTGLDDAPGPTAQETWYKVTGFDDMFPSAAQREAQGDLAVCANRWGENREISQNGISDAVDYRRCSVSPYPTTMGQRLGGRPQG